MRIPRALLAAALAAIVATAGCGGQEAAAPGAAPTGGRVRVVRVATLPADPLGRAWETVPETLVPLLPQDVAEPRRTEEGVTVLRLRAAHDGSRVAFRLRWEDPTEEGLVDVDRSTDGVALQFPATGPGGPLPDAMMGEAGKPVAIVHWTLARQERAEGKPWGVAALFPNAAVDHYPFQAGRDEETRAAMRTRYAPARAAENLVAMERPASGVTDLTAEGFGTLAPAPRSVSTGRGVRADGVWSVLLARPLDREPGSTALGPGGATYLAVAVWNGAAHDAGSRKMRSIWLRVELDGESP